MDTLQTIRGIVESETRPERTNRSYVIKISSAKIYLKQPEIAATLKERLKNDRDILSAISDLIGLKKGGTHPKNIYNGVIEYIKSESVVLGSQLYQRYKFGHTDMARVQSYAKRIGVNLVYDEMDNRYYVQP